MLCVFYEIPVRDKKYAPEVGHEWQQEGQTGSTCGGLI